MTPLTFLVVVAWLVMASVIYLKALATIPKADEVRWFTMLLSLAWPVVLAVVAFTSIISVLWKLIRGEPVGGDS